MYLCLFFIALLASGAPAASRTPPAVREIVVEGNSRIPAESILRQVSAASNLPFDSARAAADLKKLHGTGLFEDVQVQSRDSGDGRVDVIIRVREYPFLSGYSINVADLKLEEQIRDYLREQDLEPRIAAPFNPSFGKRTALAIRDYLRSRKYPNAEVEISRETRGEAVHVAFDVRTGQRLVIGSVRFTGNESIPEKELLKQIQVTKPARFWDRWGARGRYVPEELLSDLQRISLYYRSRGFAAVSVGEPRVHAVSNKSKQRIEIEIPIVEGPRYRLSSVALEGVIRTGAEEVEKIVAGVKAPADYDYSLLDATRQKIVDTLGHYGYGLARVEMKQFPNEKDHTIRVVYEVDAGDPVAIGRITFEGNKRVPDKFLRRELRAAEGEVFDSVKLDKSVERLNKSNLLQDMKRSDVALKYNEETGLLDVTFHVKEKDRQGIYGTGGTGGIGGGYLGILYTAFNFLRLGETLSFEMDGGASRSNMVLNIIGTHFLGSPFTVALSVFNRYAGFNVANVVPGPESLVGVFRKRSRGIGLTGSYPITNRLEAGLGFRGQRDLITDSSNPDAAPVKSMRSELAPFVLYDRTSGTGAERRGSVMSYSQSWDGSLFLRSLDSMSNSVQFTHYADDPFTNGRNSFAFHFHGALARPKGGGPLFVERRFFPGDENVRGFDRGSLTPWSAVPSGPGFTIQASGADTVLGFSTEYRVPLRGALSGVGFFDLGWTHLDSRHAKQLGAGARLIEKTNGVLRASLGGELRLDLPVIRQPARLIFSWNPLRLNALFSDPSSVLNLVEPKTSLRFALGTFY